MRKLVPIRWALALSLVTGASAVALAPGASASSGSTDLVLYKNTPTTGSTVTDR